MNINRDASTGRYLAQPVSERFWNKVRIGGPNDCWEWLGSKTGRGYGKVKVGNNSLSAHRVAYELTNGSITPGAWILHSCDNPACCNPRHLWSGSPSENTIDAIAKGRFIVPRPSRAGSLNGRYIDGRSMGVGGQDEDAAEKEDDTSEVFEFGVVGISD